MHVTKILFTCPHCKKQAKLDKLKKYDGPDKVWNLDVDIYTCGKCGKRVILDVVTVDQYIDRG